MARFLCSLSLNHQPPIIMNDPYATDASTLDSNAGYTAIPSVSQAANDLRAAAGEKIKDLTAQAASLKDRAVESATHFRDLTAEKAREARTAATEKAAAFKSAAGEKHSISKSSLTNNGRKHAKKPVKLILLRKTTSASTLQNAFLALWA